MKIKILHTSLKGAKKDVAVNQDSLYVCDKEDLFVSVVADGLGSASKSHIGSKLACEVIKEITNEIVEKKNDIISLIEYKWSSKLSYFGIANDEAWTTLSYIIIDKIKKRIFVGKIGDSPIIIRIENKTYIFNNTSKDFLNETDGLGFKIQEFITFDYAFNDDVCFLMATDGIGDEIEWKKINEMLDYCKTKFNHKNNISFENEIRNAFEKLNNDDKTVIIGWSYEI